MNPLFEQLKGIVSGRKQPNDPFFECGDVLCGKWRAQGVYQIDQEELCHKEFSPFPCEVHGCGHFSNSLLESEQHYNTRHNFECSQCRKHLASPHLLDLHLAETHDSFFALQSTKKPLFRCFIEECLVDSWNSQERMQHCVEVHGFPADFRYDESKKKGKKTCRSSVDAMDVDASSSKDIGKNKKKTKKHKAKSDISAGQVLGGGGGRRRGPLSWYQQGKLLQNSSTPTNIEMKDLEDALPE